MPKRVTGTITGVGLAAVLLAGGLLLAACASLVENKGEQRMKQHDNVGVEVTALPPIDLKQPAAFETATFATG